MGFGGGGSSGGGTTTTVQKSDPWSGQQPYYQDIFKQAQNAYNAGQLSPPAYTGQTQAGFTPYQVQAQDLTAQRALNGSPLNTAASNQLQNTINGQYLDPSTNPGFKQGLQDIADAYKRGTAAQTDSAFARSGNLGGSAYNEMTGVNNQAFAKNMTDFAGQLYNDERNRQLQGTLVSPSIANQDYYDMSQLSGVGSQQQNMNQALLDQAAAQYNQNAARPANALANYSQLIGGNLGGTTTSSQPYYTNPVGSGIGGALSGASLGASLLPTMFGMGAGTGGLIGGGLGLLGGLLSDERLKENIEPMGKENGHNIYKFNYKGDNKKYIGVMAQEVEKTHPEAVIEHEGIKRVFYDKIGVNFREAV